MVFDILTDINVKINFVKHVGLKHVGLKNAMRMHEFDSTRTCKYDSRGFT